MTWLSENWPGLLALAAIVGAYCLSAMVAPIV